MQTTYGRLLKEQRLKETSNSKFQDTDSIISAEGLTSKRRERRQEVFLICLADFFFSSSMKSISAVQLSNHKYLVSARIS